MANLDHLPLPRVEGQLDRRKKPGFNQPIGRDVATHAASISEKIRAVDASRANAADPDQNAPLLLRIASKNPIESQEWSRVDMQILATDPRNTVVLFATDTELKKFKGRLEEYRLPPPPGQKGQRYAGFIEPIEEIEVRKPTDRVGPALKLQGFEQTNTFIDGNVMVLDIELYRPSDDYIGVFCNRIENIIAEQNGKILSEYRGGSLLMMRVEADGPLIRRLMNAPEVLEIDLPPEPDLDPADITNIQIDGDIEIIPARDDAATIGIVDSGLTSAHPLLEASVVGAFGIPPEMGDADEWGHGTSVAGVAALGDIRPMLEQKSFSARFKIASARVLKSDGRFHDSELVPRQMDEAIRRLHDEFGCKVINISLSDPARPASTKPSAWAAVLDDLARELDLIIVVAAGNRNDLASSFGAAREEVVNRYPQYLFDPGNRLLEPGTAANVITVGSISVGNGLRADDDVAVRAITGSDQPSPFSRIGPGVSEIVKPDFVDYGGTCLFDGAAQQLLKGDSRSEAGIICPNSNYLAGLLGSKCGTSLAAPLLAHKAAILREAFPQASANLIRTLLALSSEVPAMAKTLLSGFDHDDIVRIVGNGVSQLDRALYSNDNRVILYDEAVIHSDHFLVYELPIPEDFQSTKGSKRIDVALAFDPPTRRTREDYLGHTMSFDLFRGRTLADVFDACRKWLASEQGEPLKIDGKYCCKLEPSITRRGASTLQRATYLASKDISHYGDTWHLVVRCESGWSPVSDQRFAIAVEMSHEADIQLHSRLQERLRVRV